MPFFNLLGSAASAGINYAMNKELQQKAHRHQIDMYRNRYNWTRQDLEKSGYNPLLAVNQGPGSPAGAASASVNVPDFGKAYSEGIEAAKKKEELKGITATNRTLNANAIIAEAQAAMWSDPDFVEAQKTKQVIGNNPYSAVGGAFGYMKNAINEWTGQEENAGPKEWAEGMAGWAEKHHPYVNFVRGARREYDSMRLQNTRTRRHKVGFKE